MRLSTETKRCSVVIDFPLNFKSLTENLNLNGFKFFTILHDKDADDNGEIKKPHVHLIILSSKKHELQYYLYRVAEWSKHGTTDAIQISSIQSLNGAVRYLTHKDDVDKYQYNDDDVLTNTALGTYESYCVKDLTTAEINIDLLIDILQETHSKIAIMRSIGIFRYNMLRNTISDIEEELFKS